MYCGCVRLQTRALVYFWVLFQETLQRSGRLTHTQYKKTFKNLFFSCHKRVFCNTFSSLTDNWQIVTERTTDRR